MSWLKTQLENERSEESANKRQRRSPGLSSRQVLKSAIFWDIENIPVKKSIAARRVPEMKKALTHFVKNINHYNEDYPPAKSIQKFIAVARQKDANSNSTTAEFVKRHLIENEVCTHTHRHTQTQTHTHTHTDGETLSLAGSRLTYEKKKEKAGFPANLYFAEGKLILKPFFV
jgi:hypothetical protein